MARRQDLWREAGLDGLRLATSNTTRKEPKFVFPKAPYCCPANPKTPQCPDTIRLFTLTMAEHGA